jgi:putative ABC transport system substrate-binding protein
LGRGRAVAAAALLAVALWFAAPAHAQKVHRVAFIATTSPLSQLTGPDPANPAMRAFVHALRDLGFVEGRNLVLDIRTLEGKPERIEEVVADVVRLKPSVIFAPAQGIVERSLKLTAGVPIAMLAAGAIVERKLVQSLARPGGMITGLVVDVDTGVEAKRLQLLGEIVPGLRRVAYLGPHEWWGHPAATQVQSAAQRIGLTLFNAGYKGGDFQTASLLIEQDRPDAVFVPTGPSSYALRERIGRFVVANRLPCAAAHSEIAEHGCLISYGVDTNDLMRRGAGYVAKILNGAKPGDLPIEQPSKFSFVINMKSARAIGVKIPQPLLLRADRVIE